MKELSVRLQLCLINLQLWKAHMVRNYHKAIAQSKCYHEFYQECGKLYCIKCGKEFTYAQFKRIKAKRDKRSQKAMAKLEKLFSSPHLMKRRLNKAIKLIKKQKAKEMRDQLEYTSSK